MAPDLAENESMTCHSASQPIYADKSSFWLPNLVRCSASVKSWRGRTRLPDITEEFVRCEEMDLPTPKFAKRSSADNTKAAKKVCEEEGGEEQLVDEHFFSIYTATLIISDKSLRDLIKTLLDDPSQCNVEAIEEYTTEHSHYLLSALSLFKRLQCVPLYWLALLKDVVCTSPATGFVQGCESAIFETAIQGLLLREVNVAELLKLKRWCPSLHRFFCAFTFEDKEAVSPLLQRIIECMHEMERCTPHPLLAVAVGMIADRQGSFPSLPVLRHRGHYTMDKAANERKVCTKLAIGRKNLLPGIFLMHCTHGICYGFHVMDEHESPNIPFTVIETRFKKAPEVIIYDNACGLHRYALNRNPGYFRNTRFHVDRFHWFNHTGCSSGYNLSEYMDLREINSQVAEQRNSLLNKLKSSLSYQLADNFFLSLGLFSGFRNMLNILKLREPQNPAEVIIKNLLPYFT